MHIGAKTLFWVGHVKNKANQMLPPRVIYSELAAVGRSAGLQWKRNKDQTSGIMKMQNDPLHLRKNGRRQKCLGERRRVYEQTLAIDKMRRQDGSDDINPAVMEHISSMGNVRDYVCLRHIFPAI